MIASGSGAPDHHPADPAHPTTTRPDPAHPTTIQPDDPAHLTTMESSAARAYRQDPRIRNATVLTASPGRR